MGATTESIHLQGGVQVPTFICGMARGCDFYFAEAVLALRQERGDVTLEAAIPCPTQTDGWSGADRTRSLLPIFQALL